MALYAAASFLHFLSLDGKFLEARNYVFLTVTNVWIKKGLEICWESS